jgi:hypothetical protein
MSHIVTSRDHAANGRFLLYLLKADIPQVSRHVGSAPGATLCAAINPLLFAEPGFLLKRDWYFGDREYDQLCRWRRTLQREMTREGT